MSDINPILKIRFTRHCSWFVMEQSSLGLCYEVFTFTRYNVIQEEMKKKKRNTDHVCTNRNTV